eukprot:TRINITY_DN22712_c0_g1_i1.p1 TRINITY_DN22712_c0_g1~~TRINITY_DN22712_c0_g1_i1.p1  ORF type:complete len:343 (+),score=125.82 TRINITY_DN22712_c0_g1_i1:48-1076(+)
MGACCSHVSGGPRPRPPPQPPVAGTPPAYVPQIIGGRVVDVYDGDTLTLAGYVAHNPELFKFSVRLRGIDTPEMRTKSEDEKAAAVAAKEFVKKAVEGEVVWLQEVALDKYGRLLANVFTAKGVCINDELIRRHHAVAYDGGTKAAPESWSAYLNAGPANPRMPYKPSKRFAPPPDDAAPVLAAHAIEKGLARKSLRKYIPEVKGGTVVRVYDGDTVTLAGRVAHNPELFTFSVRVHGIDAPEMRTKDAGEKEVARLAKAVVEAAVLNRAVVLHDVALDKYGRLLARVESDDGVCVGGELVRQHLAVPYDGGAKRPPDCWKAYYEAGPCGMGATGIYSRRAA